MNAHTNTDEPGSAAAIQLKELHRAEVLSHTRYPRLGRWYPPTAGVVAAFWTTSYLLPWWLQASAVVAMGTVVGFLIRLYVARRGVQPSFRRTPRRLQGEMVAFMAAFLAVMGLVALAWHVVTWWVAALTAFALATLLIAVYEHRYAKAAREVELAAGIEPVEPIA